MDPFTVVFIILDYIYWSSLIAQQVKNPLANAGDVGLIPGSERSPGEGKC